MAAHEVFIDHENSTGSAVVVSRSAVVSARVIDNELTEIMLMNGDRIVVEVNIIEFYNRMGIKLSGQAISRIVELHPGIDG